MSEFAARLRGYLPTKCAEDHSGPYHRYGMGYFPRDLVADAADHIDELERALSDRTKANRCNECGGALVDGPELREETDSRCFCNARSEGRPE